MNLIQNKKSQVEIKVCIFHLTSNVWEYFQNFFCRVPYSVNEEFPLHIRMMCTLAFILQHHVTEAFEELNDAIQNNYDHKLHELSLCFEDTFFG